MSKATVPRSQVTSNSQTLRGTGIFPYTTLIHIDPRILPNVGKYASPMECLGFTRAARREAWSGRVERPEEGRE